MPHSTKPHSPIQLRQHVSRLYPKDRTRLRIGFYTNETGGEFAMAMITTLNRDGHTILRAETPSTVIEQLIPFYEVELPVGLLRGITTSLLIRGQSLYVRHPFEIYLKRDGGLTTLMGCSWDKVNHSAGFPPDEWLSFRDNSGY